MNTKILILIILLLCIPLATAGNVEVGADMIEKGNRQTLIGFANDIYAIGNGSSDSDTIIRMASYNVDPYQIPAVHDTNQICTDIFYCLFTAIIFVHAGVVLLNRYKPEKLANLDFVTVDFNGYHYRTYVSKMMKGIFIVALAHFVIPLILDFEQMITLSLMQDVPKSLEPTTENAILYFMMAFIWLAQMIFFIIRAFVIVAFAAMVLLVGVLYLWDRTEGIAKSIFYYFLALVFMQAIIVGISCLGVRIIQESSAYIMPGLFGVGVEFLYYFGLLVLLFIISALIVFYPILQLMLRVVMRRVI